MSPPKVDSSESRWIMFCERSSIRGMLKIVRAPSPFLRMLWIIFVVGMSFLLFFTSISLVLDYLNYKTVVSTRKLFDDLTDFPAVTICSHNPFAEQARHLWSSGAVVSPGEFQTQLNNLSLHYLLSDENDLARAIIAYDKVDSYYATLDHFTSVRLGHDRDMILYCMVFIDGNEVLAENCTLENQTSLILRRFSHEQFFNCWTVENKNEHELEQYSPEDRYNDSKSVEGLVLLIALVPSSAIPQLHDSFVMDTLTRGEGVKVVIHQSGTYPNVERDGINLQPGKMNRLTYEPVRWRLISTPNKPCRDDSSPLLHLDVTYLYDQQHCLDLMLQRSIMEQCGCMLTYWARPQLPSVSLPYCIGPIGNATQLQENFICLGSILPRMPALKEAALQSECLPRCTFFSYPTELSVTQWRPSSERLQRLRRVYRVAMDFSKNDLDPKARQAYENYLRQSIQSQSSASGEDDGVHANGLPDLSDETRYTYISLNRRVRDTNAKEETLVLDIYVLLSRIGGMCSLSIGLTTAFFVELIEFIYLCLRQRRIAQRRQELLSPSTQHQQHQDPTLSEAVQYPLTASDAQHDSFYLPATRL